MIKLIATDMDGTLLDQYGKLPKDFFNILKELQKRDIKFIVASGRPYTTLYENFKPYSDDLCYICDNGSYIVEQGKSPCIKIIDKNLVNSVIKAAENIPNTTLILCGTKYAYHKPCSDNFLKEIDKYYFNKKIINDFSEIDDDIFKISILDLNKSANNSYPIISPLFDSVLKVVISGEVWIDVTNPEVNKGAALKTIQQDYGISYEETMTFGDFYNDIEMLQASHYSFVMENANDDMKQYGNFIAKSNSENGVIKAIKEYILEKNDQ